MLNIKLTVGLKMVSGFLAVALLVAIVGYIGIRTTSNMRQRFELSNAVDAILVKSLDHEAALLEVINSLELEEFESLRNEVEGLNKEIQDLVTELLADFNIEAVPDLPAFIDQQTPYNEIESRLLQVHQELLSQMLVFSERYLVEKAQRYEIRTPVFESKNPDLIIGIGNLQYFSKEALYQYGDQQHVDEWVDSINTAAEMLSSQSIGMSPETKQNVLDQLSAYLQTAEEMGRIVVRENEIRTEEARLLSDLRTLNSELENLRTKISVELNESIVASLSNDRKTLIGAIVVTVALAIGIGLLMSRSIAIPIKRLTSLAEEIAGGNLDAQILKFNARDEVGDLASSFNRMCSQLKNAHNGLEQQVNDLEAAQIGLANEIAVRRQAEEAQRRLAEENSVIAELGRVISSSLDIDEVYDRLGDEITRLLPFDSISLTLVDQNGDIAVPTWVRGIDVPGRRSGDLAPIDGSLAGEVIRINSPMLVEAETESDLDHLPGLMPHFIAGMKSFMATPLVNRDTPIGVLHVRSRHTGVYTQGHLEIFGRVGNQIAGAVVNSQLYAERTRLSDENLVMAELGRLIGSSLDIGRVYDEFATEVKKLVDFDRLSINNCDNHSGQATMMHTIGQEVSDDHTGGSWPLDGSPSQVVIATGQTLIRSDISDRQFSTDQRYLDVGLRSMMLLPLIYQGKVIGCMALRSANIGAYGPGEQVILERLAHQIAPAVANAELFEKSRRAEEALEHRAIELDAVIQELESFSYSVSHDLRAPLRSIDGFGQALLEDYSEHLDTQGKDYLNRMRAASQRMGESIDGLLKLSRVTRSEIQRKKVDLSGIVQAVAAELQTTQPLRRAEFLIQEEIIANGDAQLLRVVLDNLLGNAWKFTESRELTKIEFGITSKEAGPAYFVRDNGVGFDMAYVDKLFGAFQRLHASTEFEGMGIGLATVKRVVHRHGGKVWAEGETGEGATFYFTLN